MKEPIATNNEAFARALVRGDFRSQYIIYCRKSTDEPNNQKNSLSYQRDAALAFAERVGLPLFTETILGFANKGVIFEKHSAFKNNGAMIVHDDGTVQFGVERPKFHRLVQYLNKRYFKGAIFLSWDRGSRNSADSTILKKLHAQGVDLRFVLASYDATSSGALHMDIDDMFAEHHSRVTKEKIILSTQKNRRNGLCTYQAPVGYLNIGTMDNKPIDSERAPIIVRMFELAAEGWSLADIARWAIAQGFTMPPKRKRRTQAERLVDEEHDNPADTPKVSHLPTYQTIHKILHNRFYTGMVRGEAGGWVKSKSHEGIVSEQLFERAQAQLAKKRRTRRYAKVLNLGFRHMVRCGGCGRIFTPYCKKGILYLSSRCRDECPNSIRNINLTFLTPAIGDSIARLVLSDDAIRALVTNGQITAAPRAQLKALRVEDAARKAKALRDELSYLRENKLALLRAGVYTPDEFIVEEIRKNQALEECKSEAATETQQGTDILHIAPKVSELLKRVHFYWDMVDSDVKEEIARTLFSELSVSQNTLQCKVIAELAPFQNQSLSYCAPQVWLSELTRNCAALEALSNTLSAILSGRKDGNRQK